MPRVKWLVSTGVMVTYISLKQSTLRQLHITVQVSCASWRSESFASFIYSDDPYTTFSRTPQAFACITALPASAHLPPALSNLSTHSCKYWLAKLLFASHSDGCTRLSNSFVSVFNPEFPSTDWCLDSDTKLGARVQGGQGRVTEEGVRMLTGLGWGMRICPITIYADEWDFRGRQHVDHLQRKDISPVQLSILSIYIIISVDYVSKHIHCNWSFIRSTAISGRPRLQHLPTMIIHQLANNKDSTRGKETKE